MEFCHSHLACALHRLANALRAFAYCLALLGATHPAGAQPPEAFQEAVQRALKDAGSSAAPAAAAGGAATAGDGACARDGTCL